ncbi:hypothetical protein C8F01DRAFT_1152741 [Mycena amicta]|nr:hypothetical protein C8F01DRAFT_1152741 [Mycena amicta]
MIFCDLQAITRMSNPIASAAESVRSAHTLPQILSFCPHVGISRFSPSLIRPAIPTDICFRLRFRLRRASCASSLSTANLSFSATSPPTSPQSMVTRNSKFIEAFPMVIKRRILLCPSLQPLYSLRTTGSTAAELTPPAQVHRQGSGIRVST